MEKASKADFKEAMRRAKIKEEVQKEMNESIIGDSAAVYFATDSQVATDEPVVPKKRGRKPKTEPKTKDAPKEPVAAAQEAAKTMDEAMDKANRQEESLRFLIGIARGRTREIIRNAEAHKKTADKLADLAEIYDSHIKTVEEMLK